MAEPSLSDRMYCTAADVRGRVDMSTLPGGISLEALCRSVTAQVERYCNRIFERVPSTTGAYESRTFIAADSPTLTIDDLIDVHAVTVDGSDVDVDDLYFQPLNSTPKTWVEWVSGASWTKGSKVVIEAGWGYGSTIPWDIWDACVALCVRALERAKTAYQDASAMADVGQLVYARAMPPDIKAILDRYRRLPL